MKQKGFTLIELIVVVAIIGILASISVISVTRQQKKARDARRKGDITNINTAMQSYIVDKIYPPKTTEASYPNRDDDRYDYSSQTAGAVVANPEFLKFLSDGGYATVPKDPINNNVGSVLLTSSEGYSYFYHYGNRSVNGVLAFVLGAKFEVDAPPAWPAAVSNIHPSIMWLEFSVSPN